MTLHVFEISISFIQDWQKDTKTNESSFEFILNCYRKLQKRIVYANSEFLLQNLNFMKFQYEIGVKPKFFNHIQTGSAFSNK